MNNNLVLKNTMKVTVSIFIVFLTSSVQAGEISQWNTDNIITDPGPYTPELTYQSSIYNDIFFSQSNGAIIWVESDVMAPGMGVVTNDDVDGTNCLMTAGQNPIDASVKQCSDPFQTSKRFKLNATSTGTELDLVFDVSSTGGVAEPYRILEKFLNDTDFDISDFVIELGFGLGDDFVPAAANIGLDFSDIDGNIWAIPVNTGDTNSKNLDALFPFGLFGDADTDPNHDVDGYFDSTDRARFYLNADRGRITSTGISPNYESVFGSFLSKEDSINGYFWDHDDDNFTDPFLIAHQTELGWFTLRPDQWWIDNGLPVPEKNLLDGTLTTETLDAWAANPDDYNIDTIEDLANLNLNYYVTVGDISLWPTYDSLDQTANFTLRIYSYSVIFKNGFE